MTGGRGHRGGQGQGRAGLGVTGAGRGQESVVGGVGMTGGRGHGGWWVGSFGWAGPGKRAGGARSDHRWEREQSGQDPGDRWARPGLCGLVGVILGAGGRGPEG